MTLCVCVTASTAPTSPPRHLWTDPKRGGFDELSGGKGPADNLVTSLNSPPAIRAARPRPDDGRAVRAALGSRLQLSCAADGYPQPEIKWYKVSTQTEVSLHGRLRAGGIHGQ